MSNNFAGLTYTVTVNNNPLTGTITYAVTVSDGTQVIFDASGTYLYTIPSSPGGGGSGPGFGGP